jgi:anti-sigma B factor antagonist
MSIAPAHLSVWVGDKIVCIKITGRASFHCSVAFKTLILTLWQKGYTRFVLDLTNCQLMDSTFLGVLAGLGLKFSQPGDESARVLIELLNPSERISDLLENLGVGHLFKVINCAPVATEKLGEISAATPQDRTEVSRTCLEAHNILMDINPNNIPKFKDVTRFLEEDLKKMEK